MFIVTIKSNSNSFLLNRLIFKFGIFVLGN